MNEDSPDTKSFEYLMQNMYRVHPIRVPILGTCDSIRRITPELLDDCHRAFYTPGNMILCVVGDVDPDRVAEIAEEILGTQPRPVGEKMSFPREDMALVRDSSATQMDIAMPMFQIAFKSEPTGRGESAIRQEIVGDLAAEALFGEASELYLRLYEEGIIDSSFGGGFEAIDGMAMLLCSGDSYESGRIRDALVEEAEKIVRDGIPQEAFARMKRSAFGRRIRDLDSFDSTCFRLCAYHISGFDYFDFPALYESVQPHEIQEFLKRVVQPERCCLSLINPTKEVM